MNIRVQLNNSETIPIRFQNTQQLTVSDHDYAHLFNKPTINNTTIEGNMTLSQLGLRAIYYDTTNNWDAQSNLISEEGALYIYSDHQEVSDDVGNISYFPGLRIGDGSSYLIDLPFLSDGLTVAFYEHINNMDVHMSAQERAFWNNKVSAYIDSTDTENLVLSKTNYTIEGDIYYG